MKEITLREMQIIENNLLLQFDAVCKKHNLRYYLDGGTLLGALCYDGFIPWDDDIDLKMPRPDYEKLLALRSEFPQDVSVEAPCEAKCEYTFSKLVDNRTVLKEIGPNTVKETGIYIDIFPMDGHPVGEKACKRHYAKLSRLNSLFHESQYGYGGFCSSSSVFARLKGRIYRCLYSPWRLYRRLTKLAKRYSYDSSEEVGLLIEGDPIREKFMKKWLEPPAMMEFEGRQFPAPNEAEKHLSIFYRKPISRKLYYQNLPKIPSAHNHLVYWKEDPCQD